jgi:deoxyribodipyrimidine photo-lyase
MVPEVRVRRIGETAPDPGGSYVLYWMIHNRRLRSSFALQRAAELCRELDRPLVILEALRAGYPHASDRLHRFVIEGMAEHASALAEGPVTYHPYVEPHPGAGKGLLAALAEHACAVVTDDAPVFFLPRMVAAAARQVKVRMEAVDACGILPLRGTERVFATAASFRVHLRRTLAGGLRDVPVGDPLRRLPGPAALPRGIASRWPRATKRLLQDPAALADLPIDHRVPPAPIHGGSGPARAALRRFVRERLPHYESDRSDPALDATSRLSPYLHFGMIDAHEIVGELLAHEGRERLQARPGGRRRDLFGLSDAAEAYLDELLTWREMAYNAAALRSGERLTFAALPDWARRTLDSHRGDPRPLQEPPRAIEEGATADPVFNAAQRQLRAEGWFHNVARMVWGKRMLDFTSSPEEAIATMERLMSRWSIDGRDPVSTAGFGWVLGRYDRPWGPERPVFGTVRYMTTTSAEKRRFFRAYVERWTR